jgi:hypothetical protein
MLVCKSVCVYIYIYIYIYVHVASLRDLISGKISKFNEKKQNPELK